MIERLHPPGAPAPRGPYSPAVRAGDSIYVAGQIPIDPVSGQVELGDVQSETRRVLTNIKNILEGCGASMKDVVRCGGDLIDAHDFKAMNEAYAHIFRAAKPARTRTSVSQLALQWAKIE